MREKKEAHATLIKILKRLGRVQEQSFLVLGSVKICMRSFLKRIHAHVKRLQSR